MVVDQYKGGHGLIPPPEDRIRLLLVGQRRYLIKEL